MNFENNRPFILNKIPFLNRFSRDLDDREILMGAGTTLYLKIFGMGFSFIFNFIFARLYGAEVMGIYALAITAGGVFSLLALMGTQNSLVRFVAEHSLKKNYHTIKEVYLNTTKLVIPVSLLLTVVFYFSSTWIANSIFHKPILVIPLKITAFTLPLVALMGINTATLRGLKKIKEAFFFILLFPQIVNTIGLTLLTYFVLKNYLTPIYVNILTAVLVAVLSQQLCRKHLHKLTADKGKDHSEPTMNTREILRVSFPMFMSSAMMIIMTWTDTLMLGIFRSTADVGVYRVVIKVALFTTMTLGAVNSIAAPKFSELFWNSENDRLKRMVKNISKFLFWSALPIFLITVFFAKPVLNIFSGEFVAGQYALIVLCAGQLLNVLFGPVGILLNMTGHQTVFRNAMFIGAFFNIVLNYLFIPTYGITGAAWATAISIVIWNLIASISAFRTFGFWVGYTPDIKKAKNNVA